MTIASPAPKWFKSRVFEKYGVLSEALKWLLILDRPVSQTDSVYDKQELMSGIDMKDKTLREWQPQDVLHMYQSFAAFVFVSKFIHVLQNEKGKSANIVLFFARRTIMTTKTLHRLSASLWYCSRNKLRDWIAFGKTQQLSRLPERMKIRDWMPKRQQNYSSSFGTWSENIIIKEVNIWTRSWISMRTMFGALFFKISSTSHVLSGKKIMNRATIENIMNEPAKKKIKLKTIRP